MNIRLFLYSVYKPKEMNKLLVLSTFLLLSVIGLNAQTWKHQTIKSDFDGEYSIVSAYGYGGQRPYESPHFYVRQIHSLEIIISGLGYTGCNNNSLLIVFDGSRRYRAKVTPSTDNEALFVEEVIADNGIEKLTLYHLLMEIIKSSKMSVRFQNDCSTRDFFYRLDGSASAFNKMFGNKISLEIESFDIENERGLLVESRKRKQDSITKFRADSALVIEKNILVKRRKKYYSMIYEFTKNPIVDGELSDYKIDKTTLRRIESKMKAYVETLEPEESLNGFNFKEDNYPMYRLMMQYTDEQGQLHSSYLFESVRLSESGTFY